MATMTATAPERITIIDENLQWGYVRLPRPVLKAGVCVAMGQKTGVDTLNISSM
jgi:hypothetical protein